MTDPANCTALRCTTLHCNATHCTVRAWMLLPGGKACSRRGPAGVGMGSHPHQRPRTCLNSLTPASLTADSSAALEACACHANAACGARGGSPRLCEAPPWMCEVERLMAPGSRSWPAEPGRCPGQPPTHACDWHLARTHGLQSQGPARPATLTRTCCSPVAAAAWAAASVLCMCCPSAMSSMFWFFVSHTCG